MKTVIVEFDNAAYEVPEPVQQRMAAYYSTMNGLIEALQELADLEAIAKKKGATKDQRLQAWHYKKDLFNKVGRHITPFKK